MFWMLIRVLLGVTVTGFATTTASGALGYLLYKKLGRSYSATRRIMKRCAVLIILSMIAVAYFMLF